LSRAGPDLRPLLVDLDAGIASSEWSEWWGRLMSFESSKTLIDRATFVRDPLVTAREHNKIFDPPGFESLARFPSMRSIAASTYRQALDWRFDSISVAHRGLANRSFAEIADEVRTAFEVRASRVNATLLILETAGAWWTYSWPGLLVCSRESFGDAVFTGLLRETFIRNLERDL
jgi:hypothetical protein